MRQLAYAFLAFGALTFGALTPASAGCEGNCDDGYRDGYHRSGPPPYERGERYEERRSYKSYDRYRDGCYDSDCDGPRYSSSRTYYGSPRYHTTYYVRGPEYRTSYYDSSDDDYAPTYRRRSYYGEGYGYGYRPYSYGYRPYYSYAPTVRYGGAWSQTGPAYAWNNYGYGYNGYGYGGWGGCRTAYIPYGWTWYRSTNC